ncbi:MAG: hypothetical protein ACLTL6_15080 [Holdemanella porci]
MGFLKEKNKNKDIDPVKEKTEACQRQYQKLQNGEKKEKEKTAED